MMICLRVLSIDAQNDEALSVRRQCAIVITRSSAGEYAACGGVEDRQRGGGSRRVWQAESEKSHARTASKENIGERREKTRLTLSEHGSDAARRYIMSRLSITIIRGCAAERRHAVAATRAQEVHATILYYVVDQGPILSIPARREKVRNDARFDIDDLTDEH